MKVCEGGEGNRSWCSFFEKLLIAFNFSCKMFFEDGFYVLFYEDKKSSKFASEIGVSIGLIYFEPAIRLLF